MHERTAANGRAGYKNENKQELDMLCHIIA